MSEPTTDDHRVRIRGIYTTALTKLSLDAGWRVVDASPPIERRFDADLEDGGHDVAIETTADRQGVGVAGAPAAVETVTTRLADIGIDTCWWSDPAPVGAVIDGQVTDTTGRGAIVDLGATEGYLPFAAVENHIDTGDTVRVQVRESTPPWADDRRRLGGEIQVSTDLVTLLPEEGSATVDSHDDAARELLGMADLMDIDAPDGWRIQWHHAATEASMDELRAALETATEQAETVAEELAGDTGGDAAGEANKNETPREVFSQRAGAWCWFGRESRFALDGIRREVTDTMAGHHRIKAGSDGASAAVDLVESLCSTDELGDADADFPFAVVADNFGPTVGDNIEINHGKPDGRLFSLGSGTVTERDADSITLVRELSGGGRYDGLDVPRSDGDTATTTFQEGRWWYPTVYRDRNEELIGTYVNVCTPLECFPDGVRYIDLHVDVLKYPDGTVERVDDDELDGAVAEGEITEELAEKARAVATALETSLS
jgi:protein associated with RNAse G/E